MKTKPIECPKVGMIVFSYTARLVARITKVQGLDFDFRVYNGEWDGTWADGTILVHETQQVIIDQEDFEEVIELDGPEIDQWYLTRSRAARNLVPGAVQEPEPEPWRDEDDEIPF